MQSKLFFKGGLMGAPGSGKGTIAERIVSKFAIVHVSTGDILRQNISGKTELGQEAEKYMSEGGLVPDELINKVVMTKLKTLNYTHWLLDGYPRTRAQAEKLFEKHPLNLVINLNVPFEVIIDRLKNRLVHIPSGRVYNAKYNPPKVPGKDDETGEDLSQRPDDNPELVRERLKVYTSTIAPLLDFYKQREVLKEFKGTTTTAVWPDIETELLKFMDPKSSS